MYINSSYGVSVLHENDVGPSLPFWVSWPRSTYCSYSTWPRNALNKFDACRGGQVEEHWTESHLGIIVPGDGGSPEPFHGALAHRARWTRRAASKVRQQQPDRQTNYATECPSRSLLTGGNQNSINLYDRVVNFSAIPPSAMPTLKSLPHPWFVALPLWLA